jgi:hypothetical protein
MFIMVLVFASVVMIDTFVEVSFTSSPAMVHVVETLVEGFDREVLRLVVLDQRDLKEK